MIQWLHLGCTSIPLPSALPLPTTGTSAGSPSGWGRLSRKWGRCGGIKLHINRSLYATTLESYTYIDIVILSFQIFYLENTSWTPLAIKICSTFSDCVDSFHSVPTYSQKLEKIAQLQHESLCFASIKWQVKHIKLYLQLLYVNQWAQLKELRVYKVKVFEVQVREFLLIGSLTFYCGCLVGPHTDQVNLEPRLTFVCVIRRFCSWKDRFNE